MSTPWGILEPYEPDLGVNEQDDNDNDTGVDSYDLRLKTEGRECSQLPRIPACVYHAEEQNQTMQSRSSM